jgi:hypothetical protein
MKTRAMVSSFRGANTLFQGQQINGQIEERHTEKRDHGRTSQKRDQRNDQRPDPRRSKDKSRRTRTAPRHNVRGSEYIVKRYCSDD